MAGNLPCTHLSHKAGPSVLYARKSFVLTFFVRFSRTGKQSHVSERYERDFVIQVSCIYIIEIAKKKKYNLLYTRTFIDHSLLKWKRMKKLFKI